MSVPVYRLRHVEGPRPNRCPGPPRNRPLVLSLIMITIIIVLGIRWTYIIIYHELMLSISIIPPFTALTSDPML